MLRLASSSRVANGSPNIYVCVYLTLSLQLLDKPWSQVPSLSPPLYTCLHFYRTEGSAFSTLVNSHRIPLSHALPLSAGHFSTRKISIRTNSCTHPGGEETDHRNRPYTRATIEVHQFFFKGVPEFGSLRPVPTKTDLEKNKTATEWKSHALGTRRESCKKNGLFLTILGLRSPVIQKPFQTRTATTSIIVARVLSSSYGVNPIDHRGRRLVACPSVDSVGHSFLHGTPAHGSPAVHPWGGGTNIYSLWATHEISVVVAHGSPMIER